MKKLLLCVTILCLFSVETVYAETLSSGKTYIIRSAMDNNYVADAYWGVRNELRENIQLYHYHGGDNQQFVISSVGNTGWYKIINVKTNKAVDVAGGVAGDEVNIRLWEQNGTAAQLFKFENAGNGYYFIKNKLGYYWDVYWGECRDEANIQTCRKNGGNNQKWLLTSVAGTNNNQNEYEATLSYKTVVLNFSNFNEWREEMRKAQLDAMGGISAVKKYYDSPSDTMKVINGGKAIKGIKVLSYKTIEVQIPIASVGTPRYKKERFKFPRKIQFTLHEHRITNSGLKLAEDLQSLRVETTCPCGFKSTFEWQIPWEAVTPLEAEDTISIRPLFIDKPW